MLLMALAFFYIFFFFQAEDGIRDLVRSRGLGDVYKRQVQALAANTHELMHKDAPARLAQWLRLRCMPVSGRCLLYTSDAADERSSVDLGGRRIIKKKKSANSVIGRSSRE